MLYLHTDSRLLCTELQSTGGHFFRRQHLAAFSRYVVGSRQLCVAVLSGSSLADVSGEHSASIFRVEEVKGVIIQAALFSNISINFYQSTLRHIPFIIMCNCSLHASADELFDLQ